jgi:NAD(P)-dependent dehydrogenase (short-subunit alcohol dehydrogenase family)
MEVSFREFLAEQRLDLPLLATTKTCSGGTYIVTGANVGLGFETAKHLVGLGAGKVILAVRNVQAGETAKADIETATKTNNVAEVWPLDLASYDSVKHFAKNAIDKLDRIDALIENASVALDKWVTADGYESSIKINVLGTLLLGVLLLPKIIESARRFKILPHLVVVTSEVSFTAKTEFGKIKDDPLLKMNDQQIADVTQRYGPKKP